jgi:hypothetical protein
MFGFLRRRDGCAAHLMIVPLATVRYAAHFSIILPVFVWGETPLPLLASIKALDRPGA